MDFLWHSAKGTTWKTHKYIKKENGRYVYPKDEFQVDGKDKVGAIVKDTTVIDRKTGEEVGDNYMLGYREHTGLIKKNVGGKAAEKAVKATYNNPLNKTKASIAKVDSIVSKLTYEGKEKKKNSLTKTSASSKAKSAVRKSITKSQANSSIMKGSTKVKAAKTKIPAPRMKNPGTKVRDMTINAVRTKPATIEGKSFRSKVTAQQIALPGLVRYKQYDMHDYETEYEKRRRKRASRNR